MAPAAALGSRRCPCALPLHARPCAPSQVEVLSVVAQQIMAIMEAIKARKSEFIFMDRMVKCNWQCAWRGYGRCRVAALDCTCIPPGRRHLHHDEPRLCWPL